jgi:uracil-DNA glycosylase
MTDLNKLNDLNDQPRSKLSRRNVVVGTVWAVPVIMAVGAAPAFAASTLVRLVVTAQGKNLTFTFTTTGGKANDTVTITAFGGGFNATGQLPGAVTIVNNSAAIPIAASTNPSGPPATTSYTVTFTITGLGTLTRSFLY